MKKQDMPMRDTFTFSLGGATTIASFATVPAISHKFINRMLDKRFQQNEDDVQTNCPVTFKRCA